MEGRTVRKLVLIGIVVALILAGIGYSTVSEAAWYAGIKKSSTYGGSVTIWTPSSQPYIASGTTSHWISIACCDWVQAGWLHVHGESTAKPYVEYKIGQSYGLTYYGTQSWGTSKIYEVSHTGSETWNAYISGSNKGGFGPISAPREVQALSEVQGSSQNVIDTLFSSAQYKTSGGQWNMFNQNYIQQDNPYSVTVIYQYYTFDTNGP
jgi:hypothetical protein